MLSNNNLNFSLWLDFVERDFILNGEFEKLINNGTINGATSNPAIFSKAILTSKAYLSQIKELKKNNLSAKEIYEELAITDIKLSAEKLRPLYEKNNKTGFISIEVDPFFANDTTATVTEGKRLFQKINMPNVMIKVPATEAGYSAMEQLASDGININSTLIFSKEQALKSALAINNGQRKSQKESFAVLSVFISRLDRAVDEVLAEKNIKTTKWGIINANEIYNTISEENYKNIAVLFASTGTKTDDISPDYYVTNLLAKNSVNTAPLETILEFKKTLFDELNLRESLPLVDSFADTMSEIKQNININGILENLKQDGLIAFQNEFDKILKYLK
jgi:transaldolase